MGLSIVERRDGLAQKLCALTFDDGPAPWTPPILDLLRVHGALATFFVIGEHVQADEELLRRIVAERHEVGNHTFSHPRLTDEDESAIRTEIEQASEAIAAAAGFRPALFRPPYFARDERVDRIVADLGFETMVLCSVYSSDWQLASSEPIVENVVSGIQPGAIVGLHDGRPRRAVRSAPSRLPTVEALERILPALSSQGYRFVTISGLLAVR